MHSEVLKLLKSLKEEILDITEVESLRLLESTESITLQNEIQEKILDLLTEAAEAAEVIIEDTLKGEYDEDDQPDYMDDED